MGEIQTGKTDSIYRIYQIMIVNMLNNWNSKYSSHFIIKFIGFMSIYYDINLDSVLSIIVFNNLYLGFIDLLQFESIKLFFLSKKHKTNICYSTKCWSNLTKCHSCFVAPTLSSTSRFFALFVRRPFVSFFNFEFLESRDQLAPEF